MVSMSLISGFGDSNMELGVGSMMGVTVKEAGTGGGAGGVEGAGGSISFIS